MTALVSATNAVLDRIKSDPTHMGIASAVNWADLQCVAEYDIRWVDGSTGRGVLVEEGSPDAYDFARKIREMLAAEGFENVEVRCGW